jgi:hypothetical protein
MGGFRDLASVSCFCPLTRSFITYFASIRALVRLYQPPLDSEFVAFLR